LEKDSVKSVYFSKKFLNCETNSTSGKYFLRAFQQMVTYISTGFDNFIM
jgi:hypothetical protein